MTGDSRLRGNDGRGWGMGNAKAQGRNEKQARDSRLRGNDVMGVGYDGVPGFSHRIAVVVLPP